MNKWNIVGAQANLTPNGKGLRKTAYDGIYLRAKGTRGIWAVSLWLEDTQNDAQLYQAQIELKDKWHEIRVPFHRFRPLLIKRPLDCKELVRISSLERRQQRTVEIFLDEIGFYREQKMYKKLTSEEERVIIHKGTERPFSGEYYDYFEKGVYTCKRCGAELFESSSKFKSNCGWPSFDDQIKGAVKWQRDADGVRTEIICSQCGAHLGHVFLDEGFTPKNTRYCVNSISMDFVPAEKQQTQKAIFASGCFWGTELYFQQAPGVISTTVGYTGGRVDNPTYKQVCTDKTGHAEAVEVVYDPSKTSFEQLAKLFFETHDFTQLNRQGPDVGTQYRSAIFYLNDQQKQIAVRLAEQLKKKGYDVKTQIVPAGKFWPAEQYHQDYYQKTGKVPYCHTYKKIF
jgi:peptide methionine sulfoxide reductase msrA/msrB